MKICSSCKNKKPATPDYFYRNSGNRDGLQYVCKVCSKERAKKYYPKLKEYRKNEKRKGTGRIEDLIKRDEIEGQKWKLNQMYRVKTRKNKDGRKVHSRLGKLVEDHGNLIVFEFESGYKESFLKIDTILDCVQLEEVKRVS